MKETPEYLADKADVAKLNFGRSDKIGDLLLQLHAALQEETLEEDHDKVRMLAGWMKTALTLWAVPADSIGRHVVKELSEGRELDPAMKLLLELMDNVPSPEENQVIADFETTVRGGLYEELVETKDKYDLKFKELQCNKEFQKQLAAFDALFPFVKFQNEKEFCGARSFPSATCDTIGLSYGQTKGTGCKSCWMPCAIASIFMVLKRGSHSF